MKSSSVCNHTGDFTNFLIKSMITDRIMSDRKPNLQLIINITLSEHLSDNKKLLKGVNCFMIIFLTSVFETCYGDLY